MTRPGIKPRSPGSLANTLTIMPIPIKNTRKIVNNLLCPSFNSFRSTLQLYSSDRFGRRCLCTNYNWRGNNLLILFTHGHIQNRIEGCLFFALWWQPNPTFWYHISVKADPVSTGIAMYNVSAYSQLIVYIYSLYIGATGSVWYQGHWRQWKHCHCIKWRLRVHGERRQHNCWRWRSRRRILMMMMMMMMRRCCSWVPVSKWWGR